MQLVGAEASQLTRIGGDVITQQLQEGLHFRNLINHLAKFSVLFDTNPCKTSQ